MNQLCRRSARVARAPVRATPTQTVTHKRRRQLEVRLNFAPLSSLLHSLARLLAQNSTTAFSIACTNETRTFVLTAFRFCVSVTVYVSS
jgi:hypothetical protein